LISRYNIFIKIILLIYI